MIGFSQPGEQEHAKPAFRNSVKFTGSETKEENYDHRNVYYFTRNLPGDDFGAWHSSELWYMFGTLDRCRRPWEKRDRELSARMLDYWTDFMKTGDPNGAGKQVWKPCTREDPEVFELC